MADDRRFVVVVVVAAAAMALGKLLTPMRLWHQAVEFGNTWFYFNQQLILPPPLLIQPMENNCIYT